MAQRRMFSLKIVDTDLFLEMPSSTQNLYFHLSMRADDDGFISSPKKIMRFVGCSEDDMKILIAKQFVIPFDSGICVIKHWKIHNYIQKDRYEPTIYQEEFMSLQSTDKQYDIKCIQNGDTGKDRLELGKDRGDKDITSPDGVKISYESVFEYYLTFGNLVHHREYTPTMTSAIRKFMKDTKATIEECMRVVKRHSAVVEITKRNEMPVKARKFQELFGQKKYQSIELIGADYLDDGKYEMEYWIPGVIAHDAKAFLGDGKSGFYCEFLPMFFYD